MCDGDRCILPFIREVLLTPKEPTYPASKKKLIDYKSLQSHFETFFSNLTVRYGTELFPIKELAKSLVNLVKSHEMEK